MAKITLPQLIADIVRQLNVSGRLEPFDISQTAVPVFDIGRLGALDVPTEVVTPGDDTSLEVGLANAGTILQTRRPDFAASEIVPDTQAAIAAGVVLADSGQLTSGSKYVDAHVSQNDGTTVDLVLQWRNAANDGNILEIPFFAGLRVGVIFTFSGVATNERFRLVTNTAIAGTIHSYVAVAVATAALAT